VENVLLNHFGSSIHKVLVVPLRSNFIVGRGSRGCWSKRQRQRREQLGGLLGDGVASWVGTFRSKRFVLKHLVKVLGELGADLDGLPLAGGRATLARRLGWSEGSVARSPRRSAMTG
jgi:hypothetical protein